MNRTVTVPIVIHHRHGGADCRVAGLTVFDRLLVAAHRAGCRPITVVAEETLPAHPRALALGVEVTGQSQPPEMRTGDWIYAESHVLLQTSDLRRVLQDRACLASISGERLPVAMIREGAEVWPPRYETYSTCHASAAARPVTNGAEAREAGRGLWRSLASSSDGLVDRWFNRPLGRLLSKGLIHTSVSPNQVSILAILIGLISAWLFCLGNEAAVVWAAILLQVSAVIDCVDGDLARIMFKESPLGKWLDIVGDQVVHVGVFAGMGIGLWRVGAEAPVLVLAGSAAVGVVISFLVVLRGLRQPAGQQGNSKLQRLIAATTNRDFSVLVLCLVLADRLVWFLWMTAIGVHVFWVLALAVQWKEGWASGPWKHHGENRT